MRTKLLYVLVSSETDIYLEQAYVSMLSAHHHMPNINITLIMDQITERSLTKNRNKILNLVSEIIVKELPENLSGQNRSRILKTSCRNYVDGDFLFIDCDTIIQRSLDEIDTIPFEIAACRDSHVSFKDNPYRKMCINHCKKLGYDLTNENIYYNSGVMLVKDTPRTREFYKKWNDNWEYGRQHGIYMDQPSLAKTNIEFEYIIKSLQDIWNCQIIHGVKFISDAYIIHYLCTSPTKLGDKQMFILRDRQKLESLKKDMHISSEIQMCFDKSCEGVADCVQVLSGNNIHLCHSDIFKFLERNYGNVVYNIINSFSRVLNLSIKLFDKIFH